MIASTSQFRGPPAKNAASRGSSPEAAGPGVRTLPLPFEGPDFVTGNKKTAALGRPRLHQSTSARVAAHRAGVTRLDLLIADDIGETLKSIAGQLDCSRNELLNSMVRFALTNRNWRQVGLYSQRRKA